MSDKQIQLLGRWASQAFKKYYTPHGTRTMKPATSFIR
jgi:hypothetical protein